jgi:hypothetical protein
MHIFILFLVGFGIGFAFGIAAQLVVSLVCPMRMRRHAPHS